jgi:hypothetical protein
VAVLAEVAARDGPDGARVRPKRSHQGRWEPNRYEPEPQVLESEPSPDMAFVSSAPEPVVTKSGPAEPEPADT